MKCNYRILALNRYDKIEYNMVKMHKNGSKITEKLTK